MSIKLSESTTLVLLAGLYRKMIIMRKEGQNESKNKFYEEPCGRDRRASEIEYLFSVSFPLVGNPSDLFGIARKILDKPE